VLARRLHHGPRWTRLIVENLSRISNEIFIENNFHIRVLWVFPVSWMVVRVSLEVFFLESPEDLLVFANIVLSNVLILAIEALNVVLVGLK